MATLKEQFQIKTIAAFQAADGTKFHDLAEAQSFTRNKMIESAIDLAIKQNAQFSRLDRKLLIDFLLLSGEVVGKIMAEPLAPTVPASAGVVAAMKEGANAEELAARLRRVSEGNRAAAHLEPGQRMPQAVNPDIFQTENRTLAAARAVDEKELERDVEAELARSIG